MISDPLRLLDCSLESDGGAAVVISATDRARDMKQKPPVIVMGVAEGHPDSPSAITQRPDLTTLGLAKAAPKAFAMAGVTHDDIDVAEIYDCFTYIVMCQLEDLGFCKKGEGGGFVQDGAIGLGRQAAGQHAWRAAVAGAHGRNEPHHRADASVARRGRGAGARRRDRPGHRLWRHGRRLARHHAEGLSMADYAKLMPQPTPDTQPYWDGLNAAQASAAALRRLRQGAALSTAGLRRLLLDERRMDRCVRARSRA